MSHDYDVFALDADSDAVATTREQAQRLGAPYDADRFRVEAIEDASFPDASFDFVICNAVLHFARDDDHFRAMIERLTALTRPGGIVFTRLGTTITLDGLIQPVEGAAPKWGAFPDGHAHYLVGLDDLLAATSRLGAELVDPVKTVNVQNRRCMTTWVWRRGR